MLDRVIEPMQGGGLSLKELRHDLDQTRGVIDILERASQELTTTIDRDQANRRNPLRQRQLYSISEHLAIARGKRASLARIIENLTQIDDGRSIGNPAPPDEVDDLLRGRMKILGLDVDATAREFRELFDKIRKNCPRCGDREACAIDLRHDPNALIWEAYCPNSSLLNVLVAVTEAVPQAR